MARESERRVAQAEAGLRAAEDSLRGAAFYVSALLCHQVAEKKLKAIYIDRQREVSPWWHDLTRPATKAGFPGRSAESVDVTSPTHILSRSPDAANVIPSRFLSKTGAADILKQTREVFAWIQKQFHELRRSSAA